MYAHPLGTTPTVPGPFDDEITARETGAHLGWIRRRCPKWVAARQRTRRKALAKPLAGGQRLGRVCASGGRVLEGSARDDGCGSGKPEHSSTSFAQHLWLCIAARQAYYTVTVLSPLAYDIMIMILLQVCWSRLELLGQPPRLVVA